MRQQLSRAGDNDGHQSERRWRRTQKEERFRIYCAGGGAAAGGGCGVDFLMSLSTRNVRLVGRRADDK